MEKKIWNVLQALDPSIGSFPTRIPNDLTERAQKRRDVLYAVGILANHLRDSYGNDRGNFGTFKDEL
jgi:hypothetical protein